MKVESQEVLPPQGQIWTCRRCNKEVVAYRNYVTYGNPAFQDPAQTKIAVGPPIILHHKEGTCLKKERR